MSRSVIYLDNNSTTPVDPCVLDAMLPFFTESFGNASSITHAYGHEASEAVERARQQVASLLNADGKSIIFTSGATEANNLALLGVMRAAGRGSHMVINSAEHKAILDPVKALEAEGFEVTEVPVDHHAQVDPEQVKSAMRSNTVLVSTMWANNEVGTINPIKEIGKICRDNGVLFHTDATQAASCIPIDLKNSPVDLLSLSAHKMYGPKGIGLLSVRRGAPRIKVQPLIYGGGHQRNLRSGTLPVPLIVGLGVACELAQSQMHEESARLTELRNNFWKRLSESMDGIELNGHPTFRLPGNANIVFEGVSSDALMLELKDVMAVSAGSACTTSNPEPSHVLKSLGLPTEKINSAIRFGIGRFNTAVEIDRVIIAITDAVKDLRRFAARA